MNLSRVSCSSPKSASLNRVLLSQKKAKTFLRVKRSSSEEREELREWSLEEMDESGVKRLSSEEREESREWSLEEREESREVREESCDESREESCEEYRGKSFEETCEQPCLEVRRRFYSCAAHAQCSVCAHVRAHEPNP